MKRVIIDRAFTYEVDEIRRRTLPAGWEGTVDDEVAKMVTADKAGRLVKAPPRARAASKAAAGGEDPGEGGDA